MVDAASTVMQLGAGLAAALAVLRVAAALLARRDRKSYRLTFPRDVSGEQVVAALRGLHGLLPPAWRRLVSVPSVVVEAIGTAEGIAHRVSVAASDAEYVLGQLRAALPGLRVSEEDARDAATVTHARELRPVGSGRLRTDEIAATNTSLLAALQPLGRGECAVVQWVIQPAPGVGLGALRRAWAALAGTEPLEASPPRSEEPAFVATCRVGASGPRPGALLARVLGGVHGGSSPTRLLRRRVLPAAWVAQTLSRASVPALPYPAALAADELAAVLGVPVTGPQLPGLTLAGARELPPIPAVLRAGRVLGDATVAGQVRPVALDEAESRRGLLITAPTGAGKSTVLENLCAGDFRAGRAVIVVESKGDLVASLADLVPESRLDDVVVFDPADACPVGFNLLSGGEEAAELIVDHVVSQFKTLYASYLGPRSEMLLRASLLTLSAAVRPYTICEVAPLLTEPGFRRRLVGEVADHQLAGVWGWFEAQSPAAQAEMTSPLINKLAAFTLRRKLRAVVGQAGSGLDLDAILAGRKILLVSLAKGLVGEDAVSLLGSCFLSALWAAIQRRAALPPSARSFVSVVCDEAQDFLRLPVALGDAVAQSRGLGVGWTIAHQNLGQLTPELRQAVLANLRSRLVMQTTADDARTFAREFAPHLAAADLQGLGAFEAYAAVSTGAAVAPPATIRTRPAPEPEGHGQVVRTTSRARYGRSVAAVEAELQARVAGADGQPQAAPVGSRRRP